MVSSLAVPRTPLLALPFRTVAAAATTAARATSYRRLSSATPSISTFPRRPPQTRILQQCIAGERSFGTVRARQAEMSAGQRRMVNDMQKRKAMPSMVTMQTQNLDEMPTDIGLMPDTFIRPTGSNLPGLFAEPKLRFKMEYHWAKTRIYDIVSRIVYKWTTVKPRPVINRRGMRKLALRLHKDMYTAFAYGDTEHISRICTDGVATTLRSRINARKPNEHLSWARLSHSRPRIVSDRIVKIPIPGVDTKKKPCCIRQTVFRIKSEQALVKGYLLAGKAGRRRLLDEAGKELPLGKDGEITPERMQQSAKTVHEYFVLQKRMWMGKEETWSVWGLVDESSLDELN
ncbi:mitochondrial inner membrane protein mba1 [Diplodia corticola]|uniref:Mitochondrial inner membrane protein mba1 n=1 Tax=Diplodia corticola TaxID=236234 RepID=A0A1J9RA66_9PEZI|nr:mitochondrial inner membrane protein mba1 [Diplodia corticola]OJD37361.1 mitochondrial inner membrane protein mba1 [Diplodia corticola]